MDVGTSTWISDLFDIMISLSCCRALDCPASSKGDCLPQKLTKPDAVCWIHEQGLRVSKELGNAHYSSCTIMRRRKRYCGQQMQGRAGLRIQQLCVGRSSLLSIGLHAADQQHQTLSILDVCHCLVFASTVTFSQSAQLKALCRCKTFVVHS